MTTRFTLPGLEVDLLRSQAGWIADELREWHAHDLAAQTAAETIAKARTVEVQTLAFAEARAMLAVLESDRVTTQPQPQERWRLERLASMLAERLEGRTAAQVSQKPPQMNGITANGTRADQR